MSGLCMGCAVVARSQDVRCERCRLYPTVLREQIAAALARGEHLQAELDAAHAVLREATGHEAQPDETLADAARLLVLDCESEHDRANQAERAAADWKATAERCSDASSVNWGRAEQAERRLEEVRAALVDALEHRGSSLHDVVAWQTFARSLANTIAIAEVSIKATAQAEPAVPAPIRDMRCWDCARLAVMSVRCIDRDETVGAGWAACGRFKAAEAAPAPPPVGIPAVVQNETEQCPCCSGTGQNPNPAYGRERCPGPCPWCNGTGVRLITRFHLMSPSSDPAPLDPADVLPLIRALEATRSHWDCDGQLVAALDALPPAWREAAPKGTR